MVQAIPSVPIPPPPGHLLLLLLLLFFIYLFLEKLQMPHGGAGRLIQKPHGGA